MAPPKTGPSEEEWELHKGLIRRRFLHEKLPLKHLKDQMVVRGFVATKYQYESQLKAWGFLKNMKESDWNATERELAKRGKCHKETEFIFNGIRFSDAKIQRQIKRHTRLSILEKHAKHDKIEVAPSPPTPDFIKRSTCTPPPFTLEFPWPTSLPWLRFMAKHKIQIGLMSNYMRPSMNLALPPQLGPALPDELGFLASATPLRMTQNISQAAATLGIIMPESYYGENLSRADIFGGVQSFEYEEEVLKLAIFKLSNNFTGSGGLHKISPELLDWFYDSGLMKVITPEMSPLHDETIASALEKVFTACIEQRLCSETRSCRPMKIMEWLFDLGLSPDTLVCLDYEPDTALHLAASWRDFDLTRLLVRYGANPNGSSPQSNSNPLETLAADRLGTASEADEVLKIAAFLLEAGADAACQSGSAENHRSAIDWALIFGNLPLLRLLIDAEIASGRGNTFPPSLLYSASTQFPPGMDKPDQLAILQWVLRLRKYSVAELSNSLLAAAECSNSCAIEILCKEGADVTVENPFGQCALVLAAKAGCLRSCEILLDAGSLPSSSRSKTSVEGSPSALHFAAFSGREDIAALLIVHGADVNSTMALSRFPSGEEKQFLSPFSTLDYYQYEHIRRLKTPLEVALKRGHWSLANLLLDVGAELHGLELSILCGRARYENPSVLHTLLNHGADLNKRDADGRTALEIAIAAKSDQVAIVLLELGACLRGGELVQAVKNGQGNVIEHLLCKRKVPFFDKLPSGETLLEAALWSHTTDLVQSIMTQAYESYEPTVMCAAVLYCAKASDNTIIRSLLNQYRRVKRDPLHESTAVSIAAAHGNRTLVNMLLDHSFHLGDGIVPAHSTTSFPQETWHYGSFGKLGYPSPRFGCYIRCSPLSAAIRGGDEEIIQALLDRNCKIDALSLLAAANLPSALILEMLLKRGGRVNERHCDADTLLQFAVRNQNVDLVRLLLGYGADVNAAGRRAWEGGTALSIATRLGHLEILNFLLDAGAEVNGGSQMDTTPLQLASINGYLGIARLLIDRGANVNATRGICGRTALEGAAEHGRIDMIQILLESGAVTEGRYYQTQYLRAVKFAETYCHHSAARILRNWRTWTAEDEALYGIVSIDDEEFSDPDDWPENDDN